MNRKSRSQSEGCEPPPRKKSHPTGGALIIKLKLFQGGMTVARKLWLLFAQACTLCLAVLFVVATLRPDLLGRSGIREIGVVLRQETTTPITMPAVASHADAAKKAMPAVVNIYTSKDMRQRGPLVDDALMRRYF